MMSLLRKSGVKPMTGCRLLKARVLISMEDIIVMRVVVFRLTGDLTFQARARWQFIILLRMVIAMGVRVTSVAFSS